MIGYFDFNKNRLKNILVVFALVTMSCRLLTDSVAPRSETPIPVSTISNSDNITPLASTLNSSSVTNLDQIQGWTGQYDISMQFEGVNSNGVKETFSNTASGSLVLFPCSGGAGNGLDVQLERSGDWIFPYTGNPYVDPGCNSNEFVGYWFSIMKVYDLREGTSSPAIGAKGNNCNSLTNAVEAISLPVRLVVKPNEKAYQLSIIDRPLSFTSNTLCPDGGPYGLPIESKWLGGWVGGVQLPEEFQFSSNDLNLEVSQPLNLVNNRQFEVTGQQSIKLYPQNMYLLVSADYPSYAIGQDGTMPVIEVKAHVFSPDPNNPITPSSFTWEYAIEDQYGQVETTGSTHNAPYHWNEVSDQASPYTLNFGNKVQEGVLTITVSTIVNGAKLTGQTAVLIQDIERAKKDAQPQVTLITPTPIAFLTPIDWGPGTSTSATSILLTPTAIPPSPWDTSWIPANKKEEATISNINLILLGTSLTNQGDLILQYAKEYGVNPAFALAMFRKEANFAREGSPAFRNNNPGNIEATGSCKHLVAGSSCQGVYGEVSTDGRFGKYTSMADGIRAYFMLLRRQYQPGTKRNCQDIACIIPYYCPSSECDTAKYVEEITGWTREYQSVIAFP